LSWHGNQITDTFNLIKTLCLAIVRDAPCGFAELTMDVGARVGFRLGFSKPTADGQNL
jgi:hypothetical protein